MSRWITAVALVLGLGISSAADAGGRVDWSDYLEPPGAKPMAVRSTTSVAEAPVASRGKKAKLTKKKPTKSAKAKRKSARSGKRR